MSNYPEVELPSASKHGSGATSDHLYKIEVRKSYSDPTVLGAGRDAFVIDMVWRTWPVYEGSTKFGTNVPVRSWDRRGLEHGLLTYAVAEAHRWALIALLEASEVGGSLCIETRLVEVKFSTQYSTEEVGVSQPINSCRDRTAMPFAARKVEETKP